jgi:hypothetical protein
VRVYDNYIAIAIGLLLIVASLFAKGISYGMPPHRHKPLYPVTPRLRIALFSCGLMSVALGLRALINL